jgi:hypothetical protein
LIRFGRHGCTHTLISYRWSSDLILAGADDDDSPPPSPRIDIGDCQIALLILVFHGGIAVEVSTQI